MNSTRNGTSDVTSCHDEATHCDCEHMVVSHKCRYERTVSSERASLAVLVTSQCQSTAAR